MCALFLDINWLQLNFTAAPNSIILFIPFFQMSETVPLNPQETVQLSKLLAYVLRHGAVKEKLTVSPDGYIAVQDLVS